MVDSHELFTVGSIAGVQALVFHPDLGGYIDRTDIGLYFDSETTYLEAAENSSSIGGATREEEVEETGCWCDALSILDEARELMSRLNGDLSDVVRNRRATKSDVFWAGVIAGSRHHKWPVLMSNPRSKLTLSDDFSQICLSCDQGHSSVIERMGDMAWQVKQDDGDTWSE